MRRRRRRLLRLSHRPGQSGRYSGILFEILWLSQLVVFDSLFVLSAPLFRTAKARKILSGWQHSDFALLLLGQLCGYPEDWTTMTRSILLKVPTRQ